LAKAFPAFLLGLWALFLWAGAALAAPTFPPLTGRVVDQAGLLDPAREAALSARLEALEAKTSSQVVVATLVSLQGYEIEEYGYQLGRAWGIGEKGRNTGVLLIVAPNERKVRIEVGYGLEGALTDALASKIIEAAILPRFRAGDFAGGIEAGAGEIIAILEDPTIAEQRAKELSRPPEAEIPIDLIIFIVFILVFFVLPALSRRRGFRRHGGPVVLPPVVFHDWNDRGGRSGGWGGGGGFSGGGGSFGGGGSSGSW
jgi:uncharacterized protein